MRGEKERSVRLLFEITPSPYAAMGPAGGPLGLGLRLTGTGSPFPQVFGPYLLYSRVHYSFRTEKTWQMKSEIYKDLLYKCRAYNLFASLSSIGD